ncbi:recombinase family protein [Sulfurimonas aquatica]|uniref:recombinase family protein n=1 Tax=Sulfurimonas aquatica TaxID=2672570 RepID=UPI001F600B01|nr:recombinase family protein [Sulfurimonas aquatica]
MYVRYARVSTLSQNLENQIDLLKDAGCKKIFSEKRFGKNKANREQFNIMMDFVREGIEAAKKKEFNLEEKLF